MNKSMDRTMMNNKNEHETMKEKRALWEEEYIKLLKELTFNSKPIINQLTILAGEHEEESDWIITLVEKEVLETRDVSRKLPLFYLMDSMCKNIQGVYLQKWEEGDRIVRFFTRLYEQMDIKKEEKIKNEMKRVVQTWEKGHVFDVTLIQKINRWLEGRGTQRKERTRKRDEEEDQEHEHFLERDKSEREKYVRLDDRTRGHPSSHSYDLHPEGKRYIPNHYLPYPPPPPFPMAAGTRFEPAGSSSMPLTAHGMGYYPPFNSLTGFLPNYDTLQANNINTSGPSFVMDQVHHLQALIQSGTLDHAQLQQVIMQLNNLTRDVRQYGPYGPYGPPPLLPERLLPGYETQVPSLPIPPVVPSLIGAPGSQGRSGPLPSTSKDLVNNLTTLGILNTQSNELHNSSLGVASLSPQLQSVHAAKFQSNATEHELPLVELSNEGIKRQYPNAIESIYEFLPLQCKTCGFRFPSNIHGKKEMADHLDWHFRCNRKLKERLKKPTSRNWYISEKDWITYVENEGPEKSAPSFFGEQEGENHEVPEEENLVVVETEEDQICNVCQEKFPKIWNEEHENWVYKNAIKVENKIYHTKCFKDLNTTHR